MSNFTKGPWEVSTGRADIGGHGHTCWLVGQKFGSVGCAVVILPDEDDSPEARIERKATADFIAAAPDLYEVLQQQLAQWQLIANLVDDDPAVMATIEASMRMIKSALIKAQGGGK